AACSPKKFHIKEPKDESEARHALWQEPPSSHSNTTPPPTPTIATTTPRQPDCASCKFIAKRHFYMMADGGSSFEPAWIELSQHLGLMLLVLDKNVALLANK
ncbi:hypothetical protein KUCAC02_003397, partial [Chaenocephalus aceratus]